MPRAMAVARGAARARAAPGHRRAHHRRRLALAPVVAVLALVVVLLLAAPARCNFTDRSSHALKRRGTRSACFVAQDRVREGIARAMRVFPRLADRRGPRQSGHMPPFELVQGRSHPDWPLVAECETDLAMPDWRAVLPNASAPAFGSEDSSRVYKSIRIPVASAEHWVDQWLLQRFRRMEQTHHGARWRILDVPLYVNYRSTHKDCLALHTTDAPRRRRATWRGRIDALVRSLEATPPDELKSLAVAMTGWYRSMSPYNGTRTGMRLLVSRNAALLTVDIKFARAGTCPAPPGGGSCAPPSSPAAG